MAALIINGVSFPFKYDGYKISYNKIWSANTRRTNAGNMVGTIVCIKRKIEGTLIPITPSQAATLNAVMSSTTPFATATYLDADGTNKTFTGYFGDISFPYLGSKIGKNNNGLIKDVQVSFIEQ